MFYIKTKLKNLFLSKYYLISFINPIRMILSGMIYKGIKDIFIQIYLINKSNKINKKGNDLVVLYKKVHVKSFKKNILSYARYENSIKNNNKISISYLLILYKDYVLKETGNFKKYINFILKLKLLNIQLPLEEGFLYNLCVFFDFQIKNIQTGYFDNKIILNKSKKNIVLGCSVWGEGYSSIFLNFCLPSLMTDGNLKYLAKFRNIILFIQTDKKTEEILNNSKQFKLLKLMKINIIFSRIDHGLTKYFNKLNDSKYWHLGMVQSIDLEFCKKYDASYHILMPDSIYSENHFLGVIKKVKKGHHVITRLMLSTILESICDRVETYRTSDGNIAIPSADLSAMSLDLVHPYAANWIHTNCNVYDELPFSHVLIWETKDTVFMNSSHQSILYLCHTQLSSKEARLFFSLDSELDKIITLETNIYSPKYHDEIGLIEMTSKTIRNKRLPRKTIDQFCKSFWIVCQNSDNYWRFFKEGSEDKVNRNMIKQRSFMTKSEIIVTKKKIIEQLLFFKKN